jgi:CRISPR-associated protein Cas1
MGVEFSSSELMGAWERVRENEGCGGVDGLTLERFGARCEERLAALREELAAGSYRPLPLLKILVEKKPGSGKTRRLLVPAVGDRIAQTAAARRLSHSFEEQALDASFAYRPGRSVDAAVARVRHLEELGFRFVVDADIRSCFDQVEHSLLLGRLAEEEPGPEMLGLLEWWIRGEIWDGQRVIALRRGLPQGSPLSPLLANFFLGSFDAEIEKSGAHLVRYADDFLILCESAAQAAELLAKTRSLLKELGLETNEEKTRLTSFDEGFQFLGVYFTGNRAWIPWKRERRVGRPLFVARPMPAWLLLRYRKPVRRTNVAEALRRAQVNVVAAAPRQRGGEGRVSYLYVTEQGAVVRKSSDRFLVEKDGQVVLDLPYHKLEAVLLFGNVQVTTQALGEMLEKGVRLSLFSSVGRFRGALTSPEGRNIDLRLKQFEMYRNGARCLDLARRTLAAKVANGMAVLRRYDAGEPACEPLGEALAAIPGAGELAALEGYEGSAARAYFPALMRFNQSEFAWPGRVKHPATDPLNALLSLTYTLVMQELMGWLEGLGLDPFLGFLHQADYGRPSLALDLMEPFRHPVADRFVLGMVNRRAFAAADFLHVDGKEGVYLTAEGLRRFIEGYEGWMTKEKAGPGVGGWRGRLRLEAEGFVRVVRDGGEWGAFRWAPEGPGPAKEAGCSTTSVTI